jgi:DNA helicase-2/ATP-dependent DNA helicase PcrA
MCLIRTFRLENERWFLPTGAMSYVAVYRAGSGRGAPYRRYTIGAIGKITPEKARGRAKDILGAVAHGKDPAADKTTDRATPTVAELAGRSDTFADATKIDRYYFHDSNRIYPDKLARFVYECDQASGGAVIKRLEQRFDQLYIDEIQDMAGWDIEVIELLLKSKIRVVLVGDHRQSTFRTNNAAKNSGYSGVKIVEKFREWGRTNLCDLTYEVETHRCNQFIADIADGFFPKEPKTKSVNNKTTGHDGVFVIGGADVPAYVGKYQPQVLRLDVKTDCHGYQALNFGEAKGLTFERVLIFPHKLGQKWLSTGKLAHVEKSAAKMYVGVSRARYSVAFVHDGVTMVEGIAAYKQ